MSSQSKNADKYKEESIRARVIQKKLAASDDPTKYGDFLNNRKELHRYEIGLMLAPLIFVSSFLFRDVATLQSFSYFSRCYLIFWVLYTSLSALVFVISDLAYLNHKTLLSMPLEFYVRYDTDKDKIHTLRLNYKNSMTSQWRHRYSHWITDIGLLASGIGILVILKEYAGIIL